jgi:hypothetical protein
MAPQTPQNREGPDMAPQTPQNREGPDSRRKPPPFFKANFIPNSSEEPAAPVGQDDQRQQRLCEVFLLLDVPRYEAGHLGVGEEP